jgi:hypothetical protein
LSRRLAWAAILAQPFFVASWVVGGTLQPGYSPVVQPVSDLGAVDARHPWVLNAGLVVFGLSMIALLPGLRGLLPRRPAATVSLIGLALGGAGFILAGSFHLQCSVNADQRCLDRYHAGTLSWQTSAHAWSAFGVEVMTFLSAVALARALWPQPPGIAAACAALIGLVLVIAASFAGHLDGGLRAGTGHTGLVERIELTAVNVWVLLLALFVLFERSWRRER